MMTDPEFQFLLSNLDHGSEKQFQLSGPDQQRFLRRPHRFHVTGSTWHKSLTAENRRSVIATWMRPEILIALWEAKQVWSFATSVRTLSPASFKIPDAFLRAIGASEVRCVYECGGVALRDVCTEPVTKDHIRQCVGNLEGQCRSGKGAHAHKGTLFIR
jgi:hypothetical protein